MAFAAEIFTNNVRIANPPAWLKSSRVEAVTARIQDVLEWDIHRVNVVWYTDAAAFEAVHGRGASVLAFSRPSDNSVHVGPRIDTKNFDEVFGHELAHVVIAQKYKAAIPKWVEEGLANLVSKTKVDYSWLASRPIPDVTSLSHPFTDSVDPKTHYAASTAVMEMIASKCSLKDLLQLSVGSKMETYLQTYCGIADVNAEFRAWIKTKGGAGARRSRPAK